MGKNAAKCGFSKSESSWSGSPTLLKEQVGWFLLLTHKDRFQFLELQRQNCLVFVRDPTVHAHHLCFQRLSNISKDLRFFQMLPNISKMVIKWGKELTTQLDMMVMMMTHSKGGQVTNQTKSRLKKERKIKKTRKRDKN